MVPAHTDRAQFALMTREIRTQEMRNGQWKNKWTGRWNVYIKAPVGKPRLMKSSLGPYPSAGVAIAALKLLDCEIYVRAGIVAYIPAAFHIDTDNIIQFSFSDGKYYKVG